MTEQPANPLIRLLEQGQSIWLDYISRDLITSGGLQQFIDDDGVRGETSNPSIFEKAIGAGEAYDEQLRELAATGLSATQIFDRIAIDDVRAACDVFTPVYLASGGGDGYVSIEVAPEYAYDTAMTISEARRLWAAVDRPNVMIKIPGTGQGIPAIRRCLAEGININVTLMFSMAHYEAVVEAFLQALEERAASGGALAGLASVASFFVSRVDTVCDKRLDEKIAQAGDDTAKRRLAGLKGRIAVSNSKLVYERFGALFATARWQALAAQGAQLQRVLWASTGTKNLAYSDVLYVDELIGPQTVNTVPEATLAAFRDHGNVRRSVDVGLEQAQADVRDVGAAGIDLYQVGEELQRDGVKLFSDAFAGVVRTVEEKRQRYVGVHA
ncbi:MAG: transaldolase [Thermoleophilia bacterium]